MKYSEKFAAIVSACLYLFFCAWNTYMVVSILKRLDITKPFVCFVLYTFSSLVTIFCSAATLACIELITDLDDDILSYNHTIRGIRQTHTEYSIIRAIATNSGNSTTTTIDRSCPKRRLKPGVSYYCP